MAILRSSARGCISPARITGVREFRPRECIVFDRTARIVGDLKMPCMNAGFNEKRHRDAVFYLEGPGAT